MMTYVIIIDHEFFGPCFVKPCGNLTKEKAEALIYEEYCFANQDCSLYACRHTSSAFVQPSSLSLPKW